MAQTRPFVLSPSMTAVALKYSNPATAFIADLIMPRTPVMTESFKWQEIPLGDAFSVPNTAVSRRGKVPEVEFGSVESSASVNDYGIQNVIPQSDIDSAAAQRAAGLSTFDPRNHAAAMLTDLMLLDREVRVAHHDDCDGGGSFRQRHVRSRGRDRRRAQFGDDLPPEHGGDGRTGLAEAASSAKSGEGRSRHHAGRRQDHPSGVHRIF